jgi:hypothetical protein
MLKIKEKIIFLVVNKIYPCFPAPDPFITDFAPVLTPMFAKPQIPLAPSAAKIVPRQQPDGGRVIPIQIESKVMKTNDY